MDLIIIDKLYNLDVFKKYYLPDPNQQEKV